ncbi:MAG: hypothetical protein IJ257_07250 [Treponema sp.]|nr:hypothetical protein [Treponema sp.]
MKRFSVLILSLFLFSLALSPSLFAENLQIVMPRLIYIGDRVEIRYIFHSEANFIGERDSSPAAQISLRTDYSLFSAQKDDFTITQASLEKHGNEYTLNLTVIPWKTGFCQIPPFSLASLVAFSQNEQRVKNAPALVINISPIEVKSLVQKTGKTSFLPQANPLVLPGTTALLVLFAIFAIIIFSFLLYILLHLPKVVRLIENFSYLYSLKKNSRKTIKKITALQKESSASLSDKDFSEKLQHIIRDFLNKRFGRDFSSVTTRALYPIFIELGGGELGEHQENAVEKVISIFSRLDFVRFSENGILLSASENDGKSERDSLCEIALHLIEEFDDDSDFEEEKT